jgi:hypothetical protein
VKHEGGAGAEIVGTAVDSRLSESGDEVQRDSTMGVNMFGPQISGFWMSLHSLQQWDAGAKCEVDTKVISVPGLEHVINNKKDGRALRRKMGVGNCDITILNEENQICQQSNK